MTKPILTAEQAKEAIRHAQAMRFGDGTKCSVEECERHPAPGGYCVAHRMQIQRYGYITNPVIRDYHKGQVKCSIRGCQRKAIARTYCHSHYQRYLRTGSPQAGRPIGVPRGKRPNNDA